MSLGEPPTQIWSTSENTLNSMDFSTADNTFTFEVSKIVVPVLMIEIPWPPELLKERANVILALDGGAAVQCPDCGAYGVLQPNQIYAECRKHEADAPQYWNWNTTDSSFYGGISGGIGMGTNIHWKVTTTSNTQATNVLADVRNLIIK